MVLLNNPQNPSGAVYGPAELRLLADATAGTRAIVVADEVWEHVVFDGRRHTSVLAIPDLRARSVKIGSAGKIFCLTGWKVGFVVAAPELRQAVARHYLDHQGLEVDAASEVMVTSGATEALAGALLALVEPGDEVVLFEPAYDAYLPLVRRAGGVPRFVKLAPPDWRPVPRPRQGR